MAVPATTVPGKAGPACREANVNALSSPKITTLVLLLRTTPTLFPIKMSRIISQCSCQTSSVLRPAVHGGHCIGRAVPRPAYQRPVRVRSASAGSSFDEDQELDYETSAELARITDPMKIQAVAKHLELMWKISQV